MKGLRLSSTQTKVVNLHATISPVYYWTEIQVSMDGRGRYLDNIFVERLWRTVKVEEVYLRDYDTVTEAVYYLGRYFKFYNYERLHESLGYQTPSEVYFGALAPPVALRAPSGTKAPKSVISPSKKVNIFV